jgi:hypothetical protein
MLFNHAMKFIDDLRRENMAILAKEKGGVAGLARLLDRSESQVSQWILGSLLPSGKQRGMKSETARWIESTSEKPPGWLDTDHQPQSDIPSTPVPTEQQLGDYAEKSQTNRPLVQRIIEIAEGIDDTGLRNLIDIAGVIAKNHPLIKAKAA